MIREGGPISIRDVKDDTLIEKDHEWASRKPSKRALQFGFYTGRFVISERQGMLKKYELMERHFAWSEKPRAATERERLEYLLDRALRSQGLVSLDSICHLQPKLKPAIRRLIDRRVKNGLLVAVKVDGCERVEHWLRPEALALAASSKQPEGSGMTHILSPFDPLIIQRKRLKAFFDYLHVFEAYVPKEKRKFGYFSLPVLQDRRIVAALDLKADRERGKLLMQKWNWVGRNKSPENKRRIEEALGPFANFQLPQR